MYVLGIDPGWKGGCALVGPAQQVTEVLSFSRMTETDIALEIKRIVQWCDVVYIEKVGAMPGNGVSSMFKFGTIYGLLRGVCLAEGAKLAEVTPLKWQTELNCRTKGDKNVSKNRAQMLFPGLKITHGVADALLIAEYGVRNEN